MQSKNANPQTFDCGQSASAVIAQGVGRARYGTRPYHLNDEEPRHDMAKRV